MIYHVLPGDSLVDEFGKTGIAGKTIICRECLIVGPIDAETHDDFWAERARFILSDYGEDEIEFNERVADELEKLDEVDKGDEVNLWFEHELFCQVNLWYCLSRLADKGAEVFRVLPLSTDPEDRWKGFRSADASDLKTAFGQRVRLSESDIETGRSLWEAYRRKDGTVLSQKADSAHTAFPYLAETAKAAAAIDDEPIRILREIKQTGITDPDEIFSEFSKRAGVYGFGDLQVLRLLDQLHN